MSRIGPTELLLILAIVILLFGSSKLPQLAKGLGDSIKEFKKAAKTEDDKSEAAKPEDKKSDSGSKSI